MFVCGLHQGEIPATLLECLSHAARSFSSIDDVVVQCKATQQQRPLLQLFPAVIFFFFFFFFEVFTKNIVISTVATFPRQQVVLQVSSSFAQRSRHKIDDRGNKAVLVWTCRKGFF